MLIERGVMIGLLPQTLSLVDSNRQCSLSGQERNFVNFFKYNSRKARFFCYSSHFYLVYMQSGILFSPKKNKFMTFLGKWTELKMTKLISISQIHSYKLSLIYETRGGEKTWTHQGKQLDCARGNAQEILETVPQDMDMIKICFEHAQKHHNEIHYTRLLVTL